MRRLFFFLLLVVLAVLITPPLRERAAPHAQVGLRWVGERLERPLSPVVTPYRTLKTQSEISRIINDLAIRRNQGLTPPTDMTFNSFLATRNEPVLTDPWGQPFTLERRGDSLYVRSPGPDGAVGTDDDIRDGLVYIDRQQRRRPRR